LWRKIGPPIVWFTVGAAALTAIVANSISMSHLAPADAAWVIGSFSMGLPVADLSRSAQCPARPTRGSTPVQIDHSGVLAALNGGQVGRPFPPAPP
jgi:hypothetical protein